jgi:hypothetical protein
VQAGDHYDEALAILRRNGAYDAITRQETTDTTATTVDETPTNQVEPYPATTYEQPTTYTPAQRTTDTEIREPEVPPQPDRRQSFPAGTPPPTYNQRP